VKVFELMEFLEKNKPIVDPVCTTLDDCYERLYMTPSMNREQVFRNRAKRLGYTEEQIERYLSDMKSKLTGRL